MASDTIITVYPGHPLNTEDDFRLVEIQPGTLTDEVCCTIFNARLRDTPRFEALSYTWGNPDAKQVIQCIESTGKGANQLLITANCLAALKRLRLEDSPRVVWIDAICINQTEANEKNHQLGLMAKIYTQAERVVIYLGDSSEESDSAMDWIRQIDDPDFDCEPPPYEANTWVIRPETQMLESIFRRPWFNRIWVLQEAILSQRAVVYCGERTISWDAFKQFKEFNENAKWVEHIPHVISRPIPTFDENVAVEYQLLTELMKARHCEATDPRDKVYALLPLLSHAGIDIRIVPNYSHSPARVFTDVATYMINSIGLELLCAVQEPPNLPGLPSWVPDWSLKAQRSILGLNKMHVYRSSGRNKCGGSFETPSRDVRAAPLSFTIDRPDQEDPFSAHLRTNAFKLGRISEIGDPCGDDDDFPPLNQWKSVASDAGLADATIPSANPNNRNPRLEGNLFEYTIVAGNVVHTDVLKKAVHKFLTEDGDELSRVPIQKWIKGLPPSYHRQVQMMLDACRGRRFLVTDTGYLGLAPLEAQSGDCVYIIPRASVPFVLREENAGWKLVGECYVQNIMDGEAMDGLDESHLENIVIL